MAQIAPIVIIWCGLTKIFCFADGTRIVVHENQKEIEKNIEEIKKGDMVLAYKGSERKYAKVIENQKYEGCHNFCVIKLRSLKDVNKIKELKVTENHTLIIYDENGENMKLISAKDLKGDEIFYTDDGLYKAFEVTKEERKLKYHLIVDGGTVFASGVFVSTVCENTKNNKKIIEASIKDWEIYHNMI